MKIDRDRIISDALIEKGITLSKDDPIFIWIAIHEAVLKQCSEQLAQTVDQSVGTYDENLKKANAIIAEATLKNFTTKLPPISNKLVLSTQENLKGVTDDFKKNMMAEVRRILDKLQLAGIRDENIQKDIVKHLKQCNALLWMNMSLMVLMLGIGGLILFKLW